MMTTFSRGGYTYATNGSIIVRVPLRADVPERPDAINPENLFAGVHFDGIPVPLPKLAPEFGKCPECEGDGKHRPTCTTCEGTGRVNCCECDSEIDCKRCGGNGYLPKATDQPCEFCGGDGREETRTATPVGNQLFDAHLLAKLAALPELKFYPNPNHYEVARFTFAGGDGLLMPMFK
jgi:hypothetical protein